MKKDYETFYRNITAWFRKKKSRTACLILANRILTYLFYVSYPLLVIWIFVYDRTFFRKALLIPAITFILLSLVRKQINRPRPYEKWNIDPLIHKDTKGKSMPSRHLFSATVIAMVFLHVCPWAGIIALILSALDGILRVIGGVHYPTDVCMGFLCGCIAGGFLWL